MNEYTYRIKKLLSAGFTDDQADAIAGLLEKKELSLFGIKLEEGEGLTAAAPLKPSSGYTYSTRDESLVAKVAQLWCKPEHENKIFDPDLATSIIELVKADRALLSESVEIAMISAIPFLANYTDRGPSDEGWQSDELMRAIADLKVAIEDVCNWRAGKA